MGNFFRDLFKKMGKISGDPLSFPISSIQKATGHKGAAERTKSFFRDPVGVRLEKGGHAQGRRDWEKTGGITAAAAAAIVGAIFGGGALAGAGGGATGGGAGGGGAGAAGAAGAGGTGAGGGGYVGLADVLRSSGTASGTGWGMGSGGSAAGAGGGASWKSYLDKYGSNIGSMGGSDEEQPSQPSIRMLPQEDWAEVAEQARQRRLRGFGRLTPQYREGPPYQ